VALCLHQTCMPHNCAPSAGVQRWWVIAAVAAIKRAMVE
jgi:hypothetical protein